MNMLEQPVLVLNAYWQPLDEITVEAALCNLCKGSLRGIDTTAMRAVLWAEWLTLPIRSNDQSIRSIRGVVRIPRVTVAFYEGMPERMPRTIAERDNYICAYTGEHCPPHIGSVDHIVPRDQGGSNDWMNKVWSRRDVNNKKSNRTPAEAGLKLLRPPRKPKPIKACLKIKAKHPEWALFTYV